MLGLHNFFQKVQVEGILSNPYSVKPHCYNTITIQRHYKKTIDDYLA